MIYKLHRIFSPKSNAFLYSHGYSNAIEFGSKTLIKNYSSHMGSKNEIDFIKQELKQSQVGFTDMNPSCYEELIFSYHFNDVKIDYNSNAVFSSKRNYMKDENISTTDRWLTYEEVNGVQSAESILQLIENNQSKLSKHRGHPVIAYLTAINSNALASRININNDDIKEFMSLVEDIPNNIQEIDVILHSNGGYMSSAHRIIELLRNRFEKVNFLIPFAAYSAASMMCMAADEIIMTPESSLSPFDVQILAPDTQDEYLPARIMIKCSKEAKKALNPLWIFTPRDMYKDWNLKMVEKTILLCDISIKESKAYPLYWLMKYMFKSYTPSNIYFAEVFFMPFWKRFTLNGRKANRIVNTFINLGIRLSQNTPIMYNDIKNMGLKVSCADGELLSLMRETYQLADRLFHKSTVEKLYTGADKSFYRFSVYKNPPIEYENERNNPLP
jgi:hypothetical protein